MVYSRLWLVACTRIINRRPCCNLYDWQYISDCGDKDRCTLEARWGGIGIRLLLGQFERIFERIYLKLQATALPNVNKCDKSLYMFVHIFACCRLSESTACGVSR